MPTRKPAQRSSARSRAVVKKKSRSFVPKRRSTSTATSKKPSRSWTSKRKSPSIKRTSSKTSSGSNVLQSLLVWLVLLLIGGWIVWLIVLWGVIPAVLSPKQQSTIAVLSTVAGGEVLVAQLEPELRESTVFLLDGEEQVTLPGEYGQYRLSAIYPLLLIDSKDNRYFTGTLNRVFGIFFDDTVLIDGALSSDHEVLSNQLKTAFWDHLVTQQKIELDLVRMWYVLQYKNTTETVASVSTLVDEIRSLNGGTFATRDECRVAILNSTMTSGLAGGLADIVERNGGIVIRLGQYPDRLEESTLLYDPSVAECVPAIKQIETLSPVPFEVKEDASVQSTFRAPLVAIIGENFE